MFQPSSLSIPELISWRKEWRDAHQRYDRETCDSLEARLEEVLENSPSFATNFPAPLRESLLSPSRIWERALYLRGGQQGYRTVQRALKCPIIELPLLEKEIEGAIFPAISLYFESEPGKSIQEAFWYANLVALMPPYALPLTNPMVTLKHGEFLSSWSILS